MRPILRSFISDCNQTKVCCKTSSDHKRNKHSVIVWNNLSFCFAIGYYWQTVRFGVLTRVGPQSPLSAHSVPNQRALTTNINININIDITSLISASMTTDRQNWQYLDSRTTRLSELPFDSAWQCTDIEDCITQAGVAQHQWALLSQQRTVLSELHQCCHYTPLCGTLRSQCCTGVEQYYHRHWW